MKKTAKSIFIALLSVVFFIPSSFAVTIEEIAWDCTWTDEYYNTFTFDRQGSSITGMWGTSTYISGYLTEYNDDVILNASWNSGRNREGRFTMVFDSPSTYNGSGWWTSIDYTRRMRLKGSTPCVGGVAPAPSGGSTSSPSNNGSNGSSSSGSGNGTTVNGGSASSSASNGGTTVGNGSSGSSSSNGGANGAGMTGSSNTGASGGTSANGGTNGSTSGTSGRGSFGINDIDFGCVWKSTYGDIYWTRRGDEVTGYYGNDTKTIAGTLYSQADGTIQLRGLWGRTNSSRSGKFVFTFTDPLTFEGYYGNNNAWNGRTDCARRSGHHGSHTDHDQPLRINQIDFSCAWKSTYGDIHLTKSGNQVTGYYGNTTKTISGTLYALADGTVELRGQWGRTNSSRSGSLVFTFTKKDEFKGFYAGTPSALRGYAWNGSNKCK